MSIKSGIKIAASAIVLTVILGYAYLKTEPFVKGPNITVVYPKNGLTVYHPFLFIEGEVERAARILLNGKQIYTNEAGILREEVLLAEGFNILELAASDRFGRTIKKVLEIVYNQ